VPRRRHGLRDISAAQPPGSNLAGYRNWERRGNLAGRSGYAGKIQKGGRGGAAERPFRAGAGGMAKRSPRDVIRDSEALGHRCALPQAPPC
jgi:hypothetical protein